MCTAATREDVLHFVEGLSQPCGAVLVGGPNAGLSSPACSNRQHPVARVVVQPATVLRFGLALSSFSPL